MSFIKAAKTKEENLRIVFELFSLKYPILSKKTSPWAQQLMSKFQRGSTIKYRDELEAQIVQRCYLNNANKKSQHKFFLPNEE